MKQHPLEPDLPTFPLLALDVSDKRIGFAVSSTGHLIFPRGTWHRRKLAEDVSAIQRKMQQENASMLVLGLPLRTDGKPSPQAQKVRALGHALRQAGVGVFYQDERFTTQSARELLRAGEDLDALSAVQILELFLGRWRNEQAAQTAQTEQAEQPEQPE